MSRPNLFALFKEKTDVTPNVYWNMLRVNEACRMLHQDGYKMYALAADLGFTNEGNFSRFFRSHVGVSHSPIVPPSPALAPPSGRRRAGRRGSRRHATDLRDRVGNRPG